jgi:putative ABC transport system permease protein
MPDGFDFPNRAQAWTPLVIRFNPGNSLMRPVVGRLKPGMTVTQARSQFDAFMQQLADPGDRTSGDWQVGILPLKELLVGDVRRPLQILAASVAFVLLIACGNVANLLLARASGRQREMAIRAALGAGRSRLVRQLLTESTLLALAGGACGILAAQWAVRGLLAVAPRRIPRLDGIGVDGTVVAFAVGVSVASGIVFGLTPALQLARRRSAGSLLPGGRSVARGQERLRAVLVAGEIALALILLTGAGLLLKSFVKLRAVDPGFRPENTVALTVSLPESKYQSVEQVQAFHRDLLSGLAALPDAHAAGAVNWRPLGDMLITGDFQVEGAAAQPAFNVDKPAVSHGYFSAMGIRLLRGRDFTADDARGPGVAIVSRSVARAIAASEEAAVGARVTLESRPTPRDWLTVVGVVDDVRHWGQARDAHPAVYRPYGQVQRPFFLRQMSFVVRSKEDPARIIPSIRQVLSSVDKDQPPASIELMSNVLSNTTAEPAFQARLLGAFALLALALAVIGTYGVIAYSVSLRTHEIGLRMALGARGGAVLWMVLRQTLIVGVVGVAIGILGGLVATRLLKTLLFEVTPTDPATFGVVALTILTAAFAAGLLPATRATRIDPLVALRDE